MLGREVFQYVMLIQTKHSAMEDNVHKREEKLCMKERPPLRPYAEQQEASYRVKHVSSLHINQACEQNVSAG